MNNLNEDVPKVFLEHFFCNQMPAESVSVAAGRKGKGVW